MLYWKSSTIVVRQDKNAQDIEGPTQAATSSRKHESVLLLSIGAQNFLFLYTSVMVYCSCPEAAKAAAFACLSSKAALSLALIVAAKLPHPLARTGDGRTEEGCGRLVILPSLTGGRAEISLMVASMALMIVCVEDILIVVIVMCGEMWYGIGFVVL
jgi:hypothetical protein